MTTPTQAQIEAAAKALRGYLLETGMVFDLPVTDSTEAAIRALTAAAQVGDAADQEARGECFDMGWEKAIERCAQVAERMQKIPYGYQEPSPIAAAIRKLKVEP